MHRMSINTKKYYDRRIVILKALHNEIKKRSDNQEYSINFISAVQIYIKKAPKPKINVRAL